MGKKRSNRTYRKIHPNSRVTNLILFLFLFVCFGTFLILPYLVTSWTPSVIRVYKLKYLRTKYNYYAADFMMLTYALSNFEYYPYSITKWGLLLTIPMLLFNFKKCTFSVSHPSSLTNFFSLIIKNITKFIWTEWRTLSE